MAVEKVPRKNHLRRIHLKSYHLRSCKNIFFIPSIKLLNLLLNELKLIVKVETLKAIKAYLKNNY